MLNCSICSASESVAKYYWILLYKIIIIVMSKIYMGVTQDILFLIYINSILASLLKGK